MKTYIITWKHDNGSIKTNSIQANSEEEARKEFFSSTEECNIILKVEQA